MKPQPKGERMAKTMESASPASPKTRVAKSPTAEEIALRAYQIYLERGATPGNEFEDWIQAERELLGKTARRLRKTESQLWKTAKRAAKQR